MNAREQLDSVWIIAHVIPDVRKDVPIVATGRVGYVRYQRMTHSMFRYKHGYTVTVTV